MRVIVIFLLLLFSFGTTTVAQVWDTTKQLSRHEGGYAKFSPSVKASVIYNGYLGIEVARVRNSLSLVWLLNNTATKYYGLQWTANKNYKAGLFGIKMGGEVDFRFLHMGAGLLAQTDFNKVKLYAIPTAGISWWGTLGFYYGFILHFGKEDFTGNNDFQLGMKYNFTGKLAKTFRQNLNY